MAGSSYGLSFRVVCDYHTSRLGLVVPYIGIPGISLKLLHLLSEQDPRLSGQSSSSGACGIQTAGIRHLMPHYMVELVTIILQLVSLQFQFNGIVKDFSKMGRGPIYTSLLGSWMQQWTLFKIWWQPNCQPDTKSCLHISVNVNHGPYHGKVGLGWPADHT